MERTIEFDLLRFAKLLWKKLWIIVLCAVIVATAVCVYVVNFTVPIYRATVSFSVNNTIHAEDMSGITSSDLDTSQKLVDTCIYVLMSNNVLEKVSEEIKWDLSVSQIRGLISASGVGKTQCFTVSVSHPNPQAAADISNALEQAVVEKIPTYIKGSSLSIIDHAQTPSAPISNNIRRKTFLGAVMGAAFAVVVFFVIELLDKRIKDENDLQRISSLAILGVIPSFSEKQDTYYSNYAKNEGNAE